MLPNDNQQELFFQLALSFVKDVGPITGRALLARFENAENIFKASSKELISVDGMGLSRISAIKDVEVFKKAEKEFEFCEKEKISIVTLKDAHYPKRFLNCEDAPLLFFYKGNANLNVSKVISIIGTRKNTDYGDSFATYGPVGVIVRMGDKIQRLVSVSNKGVTLVNNESLRDTLIDLHNYAAMAIMLIDEKKTEKI